MLTETEMDLIKTLQDAAKLNIREANLEIGVMLKCKEKFMASPEITGLADYFITLAQYQIEENHADIIKWRAWEKESCRI